MRKAILIIFVSLFLMNSVFALDCSNLTEDQCKASQVWVKSLTPSVDSTGREYYSNELITLDEDTSSEDLTKAKTRVESDFKYVINLLTDYKGNLQTEEERGLYGDSHQIFEDCEDIISLIDSKISFFQNLQNQIQSQSNGAELRDLRASARKEWLEVYLIEKYAYLRLQPARAIVGTKCSVEETLEGNIPYLSEHFNLYPLWVEFKQRALNDQNIYDSSKQGFVQSWLDSAQEWEEVWFNPPQGYCDNNQNQTNKTKSISVGAIDLERSNFSFENAQNKLNSLLTSHPDVELIVTPEFLFYYGYQPDPVIVDCSNSVCNIESIGTDKSDELKEIIEYFIDTANQNNLTIVLGTISERIVVNNINVSISTQLIINKNGQIIGKHRATKKAEYYSKDVGNCGENPEFCYLVYQAQLETVRTFNVANNKGESFKIIPVICGEKGDDDFINLLSDSNAEIAVLSEFDRDCDYEETTIRIQAGENIQNIPDNICASVIVYIMQDWIDNNLLQQDSYWLISNAGDRGQTGIISWDAKQVGNLDLTEDYIYGKINVGAGK